MSCTTKKDGIAYVTLNRPKVLNALNRKTWEELHAVFEDAQHDPEVRGVILTGGGDKAFIAGADISELAHLTAVEAEKSEPLWPVRAQSWWRTSASP